MALKSYLKLMRPHQYYKNVLIYLPVAFGHRESFEAWITFVVAMLPVLTLGFAVLCAISSATYIFNDIADIEKDAAHPEKKERPLPSGKASRSSARILAAVLLVGGFVVAWLQSFGLFLMIIIYIINSQLYNFYLRKWAIVDVISIAIGFVVRAIAGTFLIGLPFTSWLVIGVFFVALVLGFGKRKNELQLLGEDAAKHKPVFTQYNDTILNHGISMSATWVVAFYALYCYTNYGQPPISIEQPVIMTVPIVAGLVLRYVYLVMIGSPVGRKPHLALKDKGILIGGILFALSLIFTMFFYGTVYDFFFNLYPPLFPPIIPP